jgi:hypothetical protein
MPGQNRVVAGIGSAFPLFQSTSYILKGMRQIIACNGPGGTDAVCSAAQAFCNPPIFEALSGSWDPYYVPTATPDPYPPPLETYLHNPAVTSKIGSKSTWLETNFPGVYYKFAATGDWMRSARPALEEVIDADVRTVIYAGDADYIVNYIGVEAMVRARVPSVSPSTPLPRLITGMSLCNCAG